MTDSTKPPTPTPQAATSSTASALSSMEPNEVNTSSILEERLIDAEYKIWKKNTPYLYDFVMTHSLEWPSLTCQWLPTVKTATGSASGSGGNLNGSGGASAPVPVPSATSTNATTTGADGQEQGLTAAEHSILVGTHTTGEQNYLMVASVNLPLNEQVMKDSKDTGNSVKDNGGVKDMEEDDEEEEDEEQKKAMPTFTSANYDEEKNEVGGFGHAPSAIGKIEIRMKVKHEGEVNRARYMPQNHFIVASRGPNPEVFIFDLSKHSSFPDENSPPQPQGVCVGHTGEGYGMCWSPHKEGMLITGSEDTTVCLWDVNAVTNAKASSAALGASSGTQIEPLATFRSHTEFVEDVDWHHRDENLIGSVGDDKSIRIWDIRKGNTSSSIHTVLDAHKADINSLAFNPVNEYLLATGSADKVVSLWDLRNLKNPIQNLIGHTDQVYQVEWAPFNESILASCSSDRRVGIWDLSRIGMEQSPEDAEDGPPELLFLHGGHTSKVSDFSWNRNDEWSLVSCSEDNVLQVWNMAEDIYMDDAMSIEEQGEGKDDELGDDELE